MIASLAAHRGRRRTCSGRGHHRRAALHVHVSPARQLRVGLHLPRQRRHRTDARRAAAGGPAAPDRRGGALSEMNPGPVLRTSRDGTVILANEAARALFGGESLVGCRWRTSVRRGRRALGESPRHRSGSAHRGLAGRAIIRLRAPTHHRRRSGLHLRQRRHAAAQHRGRAAAGRAHGDPRHTGGGRGARVEQSRGSGDARRGPVARDVRGDAGRGHGARAARPVSRAGGRAARPRDRGPRPAWRAGHREPDRVQRSRRTDRGLASRRTTFPSRGRWQARW